MKAAQQSLSGQASCKVAEKKQLEERISEMKQVHALALQLLCHSTSFELCAVSNMLKRSHTAMQLLLDADR